MQNLLKSSYFAHEIINSPIIIIMVSIVVKRLHNCVEIGCIYSVRITSSFHRGAGGLLRPSLVFVLAYLFLAELSVGCE